MHLTPQHHLTQSNKDIINFCLDNNIERATTRANKYEVRKINTLEQIEQMNEAIKSLGVERTLETCTYLAVIKPPLKWLEANKDKEIYIFIHNRDKQYFYITE